MADTLFRARVERTPAVVVKSPEVVLAIDAEGVENWDLHPDGKRIIVAITDARAAAGPAGSAAVSVSRFIVAEHWFTELTALTSKKPRR